jgi:signal transduction histidine kinase
MENACKWAASRIQVSAIETDGQLVLSVEDDGPGMPLELAAEASVRGKRLDEMSPGWGLGLSIVSDLVEVNGGDMTLGSSDLGGLLVSIRIPSK